MPTDQTSATVSWRSLLIGVGGGLASVAMFYSAARGVVGLRLVLLPLLPLPTLIVSVGWGLHAAIAAALVGTLAILVLIGPMFAAGFAFALSVPAAGLAHFLTLARYDTHGALTDWFPMGRILAALALYGAALPLLVLSVDGGSWSDLTPAFTHFFNELPQQAPLGSKWRTMSASDVQQLTSLWVALMPAAIAGYWTLLFVANAYLAGRIARISGLLVRPWPDLRWLTLPASLAIVVLLAITGVAIGGPPRELGIGALGALGVAYMLQGLSVIHAVARHWSAIWLLAAVYAALVIVSAIAVPLLALLGLTEPLTRLRRRLVPIPPALPLGSI